MATEKQYIDPNELKAMVNGDINRCYQLRIDGVGALSHFLDQIDSCKTVDAVEVVRCKDCRNCKVEQMSIPGDDLFRQFPMYVCEHPRGEVGTDPLYMEADDFCSYGERKHDDCI